MTPRYIRVDGAPLMLIYRVALFPDFARTAAIWRAACKSGGIDRLHLVAVESVGTAATDFDPRAFGCDAAVEFPPHAMADGREPSGAVINPDYAGAAADYRETAARFAARPSPAYRRYRTVMPGWDNTARRQDASFCFEDATPGAFQAWMEEALDRTREEAAGDERLVFVNAWNEWAEGAYLEPDTRFGHGFLEAVARARDAAWLIRPQPGMAAP